MLAACGCHAFAQLPLQQAAGEVRPGGAGEERGRCSTPANALPGPMVLLSETFQGLKGKRERQKGDKRQREE